MASILQRENEGRNGEGEQAVGAACGVDFAGDDHGEVALGRSARERDPGDGEFPLPRLDREGRGRAQQMGGGGIGGLVDQLAPERAIIEAHLPRADGGAQNVTDPLRQMRSAREGFPVVASIPFMAKSHAPATRASEVGCW
jgi:hypothetical protein